MSVDHHEQWLIQERDEAVRRLEMVSQDLNIMRDRYNALAKFMADHISMNINPPIKPLVLAEKESYEAGRVKGRQEAAEELREDIAQLVEAMGMQGYGTLAIAVAIRKGKS